MSREITEDQQLITLLSKNTAEERIAALMLSISARNSRRKLSATHFRLPMSRIDIGNYLGLTITAIRVNTLTLVSAGAPAPLAPASPSSSHRPATG